ncbi:MAG: PepSY-associated TM helix domain-containing protein [Muribaculaceae bacterium]
MKKIFRKIHLWLSVPFGIFIMLICFSGAMMVFEKEITEMCRPDVYFVKDVKEKPLAIDSLMEMVSATLPDSVSVTGVTVSPEADRTWQVSLSKPRRASVYVDPYTGEVTGRNERLPFFDVMFHLHRWMMGSSTGFGKLLVGVSTLVLVLILLTGILMWLTNRNKPLARSLTISFTKGWPRFWHDLHVAGGIYVTIFLLAIALTGLTWSFNWYRTGFYAMFGVEASAESHGGSHGGGNHGGNRGGRRAADGAGESHRAGGGHHHAQDAEQNHRGERHAEAEETQIALVEQPEKAVESTAQAQQPEVAQLAEENSEYRGHRHHGEGGRRYHHEGDSTEGYRRHHHRHADDSLQSQDAQPETVLAETQSSDTAAVAQAAPVPVKREHKHNAAAHKNANRSKEMAKIDTAMACCDSLALAEAAPVSPFAHWQEVYETIAQQNPGYRQITVGDASASVVPAGRRSLRATDNFEFDPSNGKITSCAPYSEQDKSSHVRGGIYMVHVGSWGGIITRIINFLAALLGATLPITGYYLWIKRLRGKNKQKRNKSR